MRYIDEGNDDIRRPERHLPHDNYSNVHPAKVHWETTKAARIQGALIVHRATM